MSDEYKLENVVDYIWYDGTIGIVAIKNILHKDGNQKGWRVFIGNGKGFSESADIMRVIKFGYVLPQRVARAFFPDRCKGMKYIKSKNGYWD